MTGFLFLGASYGIFARASGLSFLYPVLMSLVIFAGSMEFVTVTLLTGAFHPLQALVMALAVNARHLFYGLPLLEAYRGAGRKRACLIFGLCDETFALQCAVSAPPDVDRGWFMFFLTLLNRSYWVFGATLGSLFGSLVAFDTRGLDFVMTAMFAVIFLENWLKEKSHAASLLGLALPVACLLLFGADRFIIPAMLALLAALTLLRGRLQRGGEGA